MGRQPGPLQAPVREEQLRAPDVPTGELLAELRPLPQLGSGPVQVQAAADALPREPPDHLLDDGQLAGRHQPVLVGVDVLQVHVARGFLTPACRPALTALEQHPVPRERRPDERPA